MVPSDSGMSAKCSSDSRSQGRGHSFSSAAVTWEMSCHGGSGKGADGMECTESRRCTQCSMNLSQPPCDASVSYCLLCSVVRPYLYSSGLVSNIKPIWKVTARLKLVQAAIDSFAAFTTILEGRGFIIEELGAGWSGTESFLLGLWFYCLVCMESSVVYSKLNASLPPQVAFSTKHWHRGERSLLFKHNWPI